MKARGRGTVEQLKVNLHIKHIQDFRNYKVSTAKASNVLSFHSAGDVKSIVGSLVDNMDKFQDWDNPLYSNIQSFKKLESSDRGSLHDGAPRPMKVAVIGADGQLGVMS